MRFPWFFALVAVLILPGPLSAQPLQVSLEEATRYALDRNIDVLQSANNVDDAKNQTLSAYGNYLPTLSASGGWTRTQSQRTQDLTQIIEGQPITRQEAFFGLENTWSTNLRTDFTIFDGLAREGTLSSTKSREVIAEMTSVRTRQSVVFMVISGYLNILRNRELVKVSEENLRRDQRQLERIVESNRVGALSVADVYRQQSQVANDELDLITRQNDYEKAKADLVALIGLDPMQEYDFVDPTLRAQIDTNEANATLAKYRDQMLMTKNALENRPDFTAAAENVNAAESGVTVARAGYIPSLGAFGSYGNSSNEVDNLSLNRNYTMNWGLGLRWTIFDGFSTNQRLQSAAVAKRNAEISLAQQEKNISVEVRKALLDLEAARKAWEVSEKALISATEDRKIAEERYNLGAGTLLDLLVANANLVSAQATRVNAITGFLTAKYQMEYVVAERTY